MADFYKNCDKICSSPSSYLTAKGIQYSVINDLVTEPVTLDFFKQHCRLDFENDDNLCAVYLKAARQELERWSQLSFGVKTMGLTALELPKNYRLMYGRVNTVTPVEFTNVGDILKEGGTDVSIQYTTFGVIDDAIRIAICRYAAGLYIFRENVVESKYNYQGLMDEAQRMLSPYRNITLF
jgi:hypothetical protein